MTLVQVKPSKLRPSVIQDNVTIKPGRIFSVRNMDRTQSYLARLGIFKSINIEPVPDTLAAPGTPPTLDVNIACTLDVPLEASVEVNASSKSNSYIGPGLVLGLTHRNMFGGGEQLNASLTGTYEWQTGKERSNLFNSYEIGLTTSLSFPRLLAPSFVRRRRRQINWTRFTLNGDLLNRPHYFKMGQLNASMSYEWLASRHTNLTFTPLKLSYTKLIHTTEDLTRLWTKIRL